MTAQTITSGGVNILSSSNSSNVSNSKNTSIDNDFSKYLNNNLKPDQKDMSTRSNQKKDDKKIDDNNVPGAMKKNQVIDQSKETKELKQDQGREDITNISKIDNTIHTKVDDVSDKISALSEKMKSILKDTLNISEEELNQLMSTLGLTMLDLLNPDNLKNLVLTASGETDISAVLTNENLSNQLAGLSQEISQINIEDFGITEEDIKTILDNANNVALEENLNLKSKKELDNESKVVAQDVLEGEEATEPNKADITFTVHKEVNNNSVNNQRDIMNTQEDNSNATNMKVNVEQDTGSKKESLNDNTAKRDQDTTFDSKTDQFINNLTFTNIRNDGVNQEIVEVTQMRDIVNQIVKEIKINIKPDSTGMELRLNPENLGKVNLTVTSKEGLLSAQFTVQNSVTKEAIESQIQILKENLNDQGVKVESIEVTVSNFAFSESNETFKENQEQKHSKRALRLDGFDDSNDLSVDESVISEMMMNGSTVSYTA